MNTKRYYLIPENFLKGKQLTPHNFSNPENPEHGNFIDKELKINLFEYIYQKILVNERHNLVNDDDYIRIKDISHRSCDDHSFFELTLLKYFSNYNVTLKERVAF